MSVVAVHQEICLYCSTLKKQVPKFNKLAEDLVQTCHLLMMKEPNDIPGEFCL